MERPTGKENAPFRWDMRIKMLCASLILLLAWLSISTTLNIKEIRNLSERIDALQAKMTAPDLQRRDSNPTSVTLATTTETTADSLNSTTLELVPHPVYYNILTLPMLYPNSTAELATNTSARVEKRFLWWYLAGIFKVVETGIALYQLADSCQSWSGSSETSDATKIGCVYGAISTLATVAGSSWLGANWAAKVGLTLSIISGVSKRDEASERQYSDLLLDYQRAMVNHTGLALSPMLNTEGELLLHNKSGMPMMFGYNPRGDGIVLAHSYREADNSTYMAYGFVPAPSSIQKRDVYFNEEDFTSGGIEAGFSYNQAFDGGYLSTQNDYGQMDHEVSCVFSGLRNNALEFQIYDNNHHGTIAAGNMRAYQAGVYDVNSLGVPIDAPLGLQSNCEVA
jgi:hypothetical protein